MADRATYHHGDLRSALLGATKQLIRERGARGFSVAEAARRAGVSVSAPYRHFTDRDAMLAAVAEESFSALHEAFSALVLADALEDRAADIAQAYLAFAREDPARFEAMFASGIDKSAHPNVLDEAERVQQQLEGALRAFLPPVQVTVRAAELWALAHGIAALSVSGNLGHVVSIRDQAALAESSARAWASGIPRV